ncbi:MAG: hypothetical protein GYB64_15200 [Chloroflexi bacterium]|nr:hypothetical protein [Chloroflexota bacterium]
MSHYDRTPPTVAPLLLGALVTVPVAMILSAAFGSVPLGWMGGLSAGSLLSAVFTTLIDLKH